MYLVKPDGVLMMLYCPLRGVREINGVGKGILREREREREMFKINRGYKELVKRLKIERMVNNKDLHCDVIGAVVDLSLIHI